MHTKQNVLIACLLAGSLALPTTSQAKRSDDGGDRTEPPPLPYTYEAVERRSNVDTPSSFTGERAAPSPQPLVRITERGADIRLSAADVGDNVTPQPRIAKRAEDIRSKLSGDGGESGPQARSTKRNAASPGFVYAAAADETLPIPHHNTRSVKVLRDDLAQFFADHPQLGDDPYGIVERDEFLAKGDILDSNILDLVETSVAAPRTAKRQVQNNADAVVQGINNVILPPDGLK